MLRIAFSLCRTANEQLAPFVVLRPSKKGRNRIIRAQIRTPRPHPRFVMALDALGCVAEKVARKPDRVTPTSFKKVALMTDGSHQNKIIGKPGL